MPDSVSQSTLNRMSHPPTSKLTVKQLLYVWVVHGLGSMVLGGGINFAIATAMYRHSSHQVWLWKVSQNTLAGDAAVTVFVQVIVTWLIDAAMVCNDVKLRAYGIRPWNVPACALRRSFLRWYISVEGMELLEPHITFKARVKHLVEGIIKALFLCVPVFLIWWPIAVAIMVGIGHGIGGGNYSYNHWPEPQLFKLIFGGTLGLLVTPVIAVLSLAAKGRQHAEQVQSQNSRRECIHKEAQSAITVV